MEKLTVPLELCEFGVEVTGWTWEPPKPLPRGARASCLQAKTARQNHPSFPLFQHTQDKRSISLDA